jgi:hypothetical protein
MMYDSKRKEGADNEDERFFVVLRGYIHGKRCLWHIYAGLPA